MAADSSLDDLLSWAAEHGITGAFEPGAQAPGPLATGSCPLPSRRPSCLGSLLGVAEFPRAGGRGLQALRDIERGELLLHAPRAVLLTGADACAGLAPEPDSRRPSIRSGAAPGKRNTDNQGQRLSLSPLPLSLRASCPETRRQELADALGALTPQQRLAAVLLHEVSRGPSSPLACYLRSLPRSYATLLCWKPHHCHALQVPQAVAVAEGAADAAEADWRCAGGALRLLGLPRKFCSRIAWLWAAATVSSRTLYVPWDPAGALCPVLDLLNFEPPGEGEAREQESRATADNTSQRPGSDCGGSGEADEQETGARADSRVQDGQADSTGQVGQAGSTTQEGKADNGRQDGQADAEAGPGAGSGGEPGGRGAGLMDGAYDQEAQAYRIYARRRFRTGEQVCICYGQYTNLELLEHYGFLLPDNPDDALPLPLPCSPDLLSSCHPSETTPGPQCHFTGSGGRVTVTQGQGEEDIVTPNSRAAVTRLEGGAEDPFAGPMSPQCCLLPGGAPSFSLLALLRLWAAAPKARRRARPVVLRGEPESVEGDRAVYHWLALKCRSMLLALPSTAKEDKGELAGILDGSRCAGCVAPVGGDGGGEGLGGGMSVSARGMSDEVNAKREGEVVGAECGGRCDDCEKVVLALQWRISYKELLLDGALHALDKLESLEGK